MPIYEYQCQSCCKKIELLIRGDETPECPDCGSQSLTKEFSVPAAHHGGSAGSLSVMPSGGG